ncbi:MAG: hypothetical protein CFE44_16720 [Burkholderiales bacterium PBB4]|nr:MAG: hypothetical protein CFE44_16720 [Burkholderiales bacterium PBB4]
MNIDIRHLRYFSAVAEELSISRAAQRLHMSQPPLSQQIQQLESRLGVVLLLRKKRGIELTAAGAALAAEAKLVIARLEQAVDTVQQIGRGELGEIRIGVISSAMWGEFPDLLRRFHAGFPGVNWSVKELMPAVQVQALMERRIAIGFFRSAAQAPAIPPPSPAMLTAGTLVPPHESTLGSQHSSNSFHCCSTPTACARLILGITP